jgi:uncharacterized damage-inducible protein DinB
MGRANFCIGGKHIDTDYGSMCPVLEKYGGMIMDQEKLIQIWKQLRVGLLDTIAKFNKEDLDFVPFEGSYSVREIILHIAQEEDGEIQYGLTRKLDEFPAHFPVAEYLTVESLTALLTKVHDETIGYLRSLDHDTLAGEYDAQWGERKPLIDFFLHVMEHEIHHRGELSLILGLLGRVGLDA